MTESATLNRPAPCAVSPSVSAIAFDPEVIQSRIQMIRTTLYVVVDATGRIGVALDGEAAGDVIGMLPPLFPEWLGDRAFTEAHNVRFPYVAGEMANGISSRALVIAMGRAQMLGFLGSAGLTPPVIEENVLAIKAALDPLGASWGANLIHLPGQPATEHATVDVFLRHGVDRVSASAFMSLTPAVVQYSATGLTRRADGQIIRRNHLFAKLSRSEVAAVFMSPPPLEVLRGLVSAGRITAAEADLAAGLPVAADITVEADSGGHTDNRPLVSQFPTILALKRELETRFDYKQPLRVGAAGGLATPASVAAAFALGAAYVVTGSVNQCSTDAALSPAAKALLAGAGFADMAMAPSADMFELGAKVQVLKRGTMFAARATRLYELYRNYPDLESLPRSEREVLEKTYFRRPIEEVWQDTQRFFAARAPEQLDLAARDPKHRMALVFRWYLGRSSRWAIDGVADRVMDYQIWCGPAMGAFNAWARGSFLEPLANRDVVQIALNLLEGAAVLSRAQQLRALGVQLPVAAFDFRPRPLQA